MRVDIQGYFDTLCQVHAKHDATEHSYRPALQALFDQIADDTSAQNEPKQRRDVGAPDFAFHRGDVVIGWAEAKDLGHDIRKLKGYEKDQWERYVGGLDNLIYTDGLTFIFYRNGEERNEVRIGEFVMGLTAHPDQFDVLEAALKDFAAQTPISITSPEELAKRMAGKSKLIKEYLGRSLVADKNDATSLSSQYNAFRELMIHDISTSDFAGMYAETVAYGMFAARLHDPTLETFSRQEAAELLPKSNPFLRNLFHYIAGPELDDRLKPILDELAEVFRSCNVNAIMEKFGKTTGRNDPFIHFYETFLAEYDPKKRKARGVWYTPEPVVNFIVRAVDEVLQTEFGLPDGLADTSKVKVQLTTGQTARTAKGKLRKDGKQGTVEHEVHRVQILDPATGTGTFLAEVIKQIAPKIQGIAPGAWDTYVEEHLIPRLHGFELLMASYAMCHMKLDMILTEMGYKPTGDPPRLSVYLTNSLEEGETLNAQLPFERWLAMEIREANEIKTDKPIMCVIGNPPYSGHSSNKGAWIEGLMADYKTSPELRKPAQAKWLSDDYVKFIRMAEHLIDKNGEGVLGFITNHGYLDNPTFKDMRAHLLTTFDKIYVLDLHGNAKKKEVAPDGGNDVNVFDIMQGVAIIIGVKKKGGGDGLAEVFHGDLWGKRAAKYEALAEGSMSNSMALIRTEGPLYPLVPRDFELMRKYEDSLSVAKLFSPYGRAAPGFVSTHDQFAISWDKSDAEEKVNKLLDSENEAAARSNFKLCTQSQWSYDQVKTELPMQDWQNDIIEIAYRPFDFRSTVFNPLVTVHRRLRLSRHLHEQSNLVLCCSRQQRGSAIYSNVFMADRIMESSFVSNKSSEIGYGFPLYLYPAEDDLDQTVRPNFDPKLHKKLLKLATDPTHGAPTPEDIFDYIYAVLHCPAYRETYAEFLKIDFPRIPWPKTPDAFWELVPQGNRLRQLHLMDVAAIGDTADHIFEGGGDNIVEKPLHDGNRVWINKDQSFAAVPPVAWEFYIGGYQPAQKWLKDRKGRALTFEDIRHYQRIIKILTETDVAMKGIKMDLG